MIRAGNRKLEGIRLEKRDVLVADDECNAQQDLAALTNRSLEDRLFVALRRISEMEAHQANVSEREDVLKRRIALLSAEIELHSATNRTHDRFPAAWIDKTISLLTTVERRDRWLGILIKNQIEGPVFGLYPHDGGRDPINILILSSGGIGDALYATAVIQALRDHFDRPRIVFVVENPAALAAIANNPYLIQALSLQGEHFKSFALEAANLDIFDLIVDVRYAVSYATPPLSRVPFEFVLAAHSRAADWQKYVRYDWPHLNNKFAKQVVKRGMAKLDLLGYTANLPISQDTPLHFFINQDLPRDVSERLVGRRYVTVHHGADKSMSGGSGLQTKNLPIATWCSLVAKLCSANILVVQIGEAHEELIDGVSVDLRGVLTLEQSALLIKSADIHFDTEGGLVHLTRAMHGTSVVVFGPTPVQFFGYPGNLNIASKNCSDCWWTTPNWSTKCPRNLAAPECMVSFTAEDLLAGFKQAKLPRSKVITKRVKPIADNFGESAVDALVTHALDKVGENVVLSVSSLAEVDSMSGILEKRRSPILFVPVELLQSSYRRLPLSVRVEPYSRFHISEPDETFDHALMFVSGDDLDAAFFHAIELRRVVRHVGEVTIAVESGRLPQFLEVLSSRGKGRLGAKVSMEFSDALSHTSQFRHTAGEFSLIGLSATKWFEAAVEVPPLAKGLLGRIRR